MVPLLLASIPSPGSNSINLGPLELRAYGLMIALGVVAGVWLSQKRWSERGGDDDDVSVIAMWAVPAGLIGARIYHVITDWKRFQGHWLDVFKVWEGGLGIPGGMALGVLVGILAVRRKGWNVADMVDSAAPALPLAQAIGRLGNWFNQELFGGPTDLPWALEIDVAHRPSEYVNETTFHPTFLYEALWNLALMAVLLKVDRKKILRPGALLALYVMGYGIGRLWVELVRIDSASLLLGVRVNIWVSLIAIVGSGLWLLLFGRRKESVEEVELARGDSPVDDV